jgi:hypothetical protein
VSIHGARSGGDVSSAHKRSLSRRILSEPARNWLPIGFELALPKSPIIDFIHTIGFVLAIIPLTKHR